MGDWFQAIADVTAAEGEADGLAWHVISWLAGEGIVGTSPDSESVLGNDQGYRPGPKYWIAIGPQAREANGFLTLRTNGVAVSTGRTVFDPGQGELGSATCPRCGQAIELSSHVTHEPTAEWELFSDALTRWHSGGSDAVSCPYCGQPAGFNEWLWPGKRPWAIGFLGFTFWNWPALSEAFIAEMARHLGGHRLVVTGGKL